MGGLALSVAGAEVPLPGRKARAMLAYLALEGAGWVTRERLAGLFWGDMPERQARNSLRQVLFEANEALTAVQCPVLRRGRDEIGLDNACLRTDLSCLLAQIEGGECGEDLLDGGRLPETLLAGYDNVSPDFSQWLATARQSAQRRILGAIEHAYSDVTMAAGRRRRFAAAALVLDPLHEDACRTVMRIAAEAGDTGGALRSYTALFQAMEEELDTEPSHATQALVASIKLGQLGRVADAPTARVQKVPTVAVLPLLAVGAEQRTAWIAAGLGEDLGSHPLDCTRTGGDLEQLDPAAATGRRRLDRHRSTAGGGLSRLRQRPQQ